MRVTDIAVTEVEDGARLSANVGWEVANSGADLVEFTYRGVRVDDVRTPGDALAAAVLLPALAHGEDVVIEAPVSGKLMANIEEIVRIWTTWRRRWHPTRLRAPSVDRSELAPTEVAACFSGGVDSYYTVLAPREEPITTLVSMEGFSTLESVVPYLADLMVQLRNAAVRLGHRHIVVDSNVLRWGSRYVPRTARRGAVQHGPAIASMVLGLGALIRRCHVASSEPIPGRPWGSHPLTDPLWSTESLEMVHDFPELSRTEKVRLVAQSDVALDTLHVCNQMSGSFENCRVCDKCQAAGLMLHIAGRLWQSKTLGPVTPETIRRVRIGVWHHAIWAELRWQTEEPELKRAITAALAKAKARRLGRPVGHALRRFGLR